LRVRIVVSLDGQIETEVELTKPVTVVGRHPGCDVCIDHPAVSGRQMLFRIVERTVYVEDLASTNGTIVNGVTASHQVVHHLDLVEVGRHKLHVFDESMLSNAVSNLESTVITEYERTMLAQQAMATVVQQQPALSTTADDDLDRTRLIRSYDGPNSLEQSRPGVKGPPLALRVVSGEGRGKVIALDKPNTMIGNAGADTALVVKRAGKLLIARLAGPSALRVNRRELGPGTHPIEEHDQIQVGSTTFEVVMAAT